MATRHYTAQEGEDIMRSQQRARKLRRRQLAVSTATLLVAAGCASGTKPTDTGAQPVVSLSVADLKVSTAQVGDLAVTDVRGPDGRVLGRVAGPPGTRVQPTGLTRAADGSLELTGMSSTPGPRTGGKHSDVLDPLHQLQTLGAPAAILDAFTGTFSATKTAAADTVSFQDAAGKAQPAQLAEVTASGLKFYQSLCQEFRKGSGRWYGCTRRYDNTHESDPDSFYKYDDGEAFGFGQGGADIVRGIVEHEYAGYMHMVSWAPNATYNPGVCGSVTIGVSQWGGTLSTSFPICPNKVYPGYGVGFFRTTWEGRSESPDRVVGAAADVVMRGDCFCVDGYQFNTYSAWD